MNDARFDRVIETLRIIATRRAALGLGTALGLGRFLFGGETSARGQQPGETMQVEVTHVNPEGMHNNSAFSQAVIVEGSARTIYVGGQNAVDADGQIVGSGDLAAQTEQVYKNLETVLAASGATLHDIIKWTIYVVQGQDITPGFAVFQRVWGTSARPPAISVVMVAGLANPEFLVEIEAIAVTGQEAGTG
jgi:enamine deaminase RidA (YjgF/YER057c/UK114 family)